MGSPPNLIIFHLPLAFVRSDAMRPNEGKSPYVGSNSHGWTRVSQSTTRTYSLYMNPTVVNPLSYSYRWLGFPLSYFSPSSYYP